MTQLVYEDVQLEAPELLIPGEKPADLVELDVSNEFGKHVITGICQGKRISHDITAHDPKNTGGYELYSGATIVGDNVYCAGDNECVISRNTVAIDGSEDSTFLMKGIYKDSGATSQYIFYNGYYETFSFNYKESTSTWRRNGQDLGVLDLPLNTPYSLVMTRNASNGLNKLYVSYSDTVLEDTAYIGSTTSDYLEIGGLADYTSRYSGHEIELGVFLDKLLSEEEARRWMADPYQIIEAA